MANSTHTYAPDDRNQSILININGDLVPREKATLPLTSGRVRARFQMFIRSIAIAETR